MHYSGKRSGNLSHHGVIRDTGLIHTMCHHAVEDPYLSGSNGIWKKKVSYKQCSIDETATMLHIKTLLGGHLSLRDDDAQVGQWSTR